jgi:hypothetical protein
MHELQLFALWLVLLSMSHCDCTQRCSCYCCRLRFNLHAPSPLASSLLLLSLLPQVVVLYIDEETSIKRQLQRARVANLHNRRVLDAGAGQFFEERATDTDIDKCRKRYAIFKTHYAAT